MGNALVWVLIAGLLIFLWLSKFGDEAKINLSTGANSIVRGSVQGATDTIKSFQKNTTTTPTSTYTAPQ